MRELKFRAWNEVVKKFYYCTMQELWEENNGELCGEEGREVEERVEAFLCAAFSKCQQFTGLKDHAGKEIYEGDIVKDNEGEKHQVLFIAGSFCFIVLEQMAHVPLSQFIVGGYGDPPHQTSLEVIGNIYENPGLVKSPAS